MAREVGSETILVVNGYQLDIPSTQELGKSFIMEIDDRPLFDDVC